MDDKFLVYLRQSINSSSFFPNIYFGGRADREIPVHLSPRDTSKSEKTEPRKTVAYLNVALFGIMFY